jgi:hypothetical protein
MGIPLPYNCIGIIAIILVSTLLRVVVKVETFLIGDIRKVEIAEQVETNHAHHTTPDLN